MADLFDNDGVNTSEKRRIKRRHLIYYLRVFERQSGDLVCHVMDVTPQGILAISDTPIEIGQVFEFMMDLPSRVEGKTRVNFNARSCWGARDDNPDFFNTGFEIVEIDWQGRKLIEHLINSYGFNI